MAADLLDRRKTHFVLWRPIVNDTPPTLVIGEARTDANKFREIPLAPDKEFPDLWHVEASNCDLDDDKVYYYWFKIRDTNPYDSSHEVMLCTDPFATSIDRTFTAPECEGCSSESMAPASIVYFKDGKLSPCDLDPNKLPARRPLFTRWSRTDKPSELPTNQNLVIYELPTRWSSSTSKRHLRTRSGSFQDVLSLLLKDYEAPDHPDVPALTNRAHVLELGVNAIELLPPADSVNDDGWGYGTSNFFAADYAQGCPAKQSVSTASNDLVNLIDTCHKQGLRFFCDMVTAWSTNTPYAHINFTDFYVQHGVDDPEEADRDGFGGELFKLQYFVEGYDPISGKKSCICPGRQFLLTYLTHWMEYYRIDGIRMDSVDNVKNGDFLQQFKELARKLWNERGGKNDRFLVVGEELSEPFSLLTQKRLDGLWNEHFKQIARNVLLGKENGDDKTFEESVQRLIDCRKLSDQDGSFSSGFQAINYLTSHDIGGAANERLFDYLTNNGIIDTESRMKLGFVCLLTAVGIPMILAGDEFADRMDVPNTEEEKQKDGVNWSRLEEEWRKRLYQYVARLVKFRTSSGALSVDDTEFLHSDFTEGKRVVVWKRGAGDDIAIVVANFSDWGSAISKKSTTEYQISNWPQLGCDWHEITQDRTVSSDWAGREPLFPWEAKVYIPKR